MKPQKIIDMRNTLHLTHVAKLCGLEQEPSVKLAHGVFCAIFRGCKAIILKSGNMAILGYKSAGLRCITIGRWLYIEQNPKKNSKPGKRAQEGSKIMWVIDTTTNSYVARVENGKLTTLEKKSGKVQASGNE